MAGGFSSLGNLYNSSLKEVKKTVDCVYSLVRQRQVDVEFRKKHDDIVQRYKNDLMIIVKKCELAKRENAQLKRELGKNELIINELKEKLNNHTADTKSSKDDYQQAINKMEQKITQMVHEMRKNSINFTKMQDLYRKNIKDCYPYRNSIEITTRVESNGIGLIYKHINTCEAPGIHNFGDLVKEGYNKSQNLIINENIKLKDSLKLIHNEIEKMLSQLLEKLKPKFSDKEIRCLEPIQLKPIIFEESCSKNTQDIYIIVKENNTRIKDVHDIVLTLSC